MQAFEGDKGAKRLIAAHAEHALAMPVTDDASLTDIGEPADLEAWRGK